MQATRRCTFAQAGSWPGDRRVSHVAGKEPVRVQPPRCLPDWSALMVFPRPKVPSVFPLSIIVIGVMNQHDVMRQLLVAAAN